ncbi:MAG: amidohydrolase family protein [Verrucomicrobia subdivision 3 bacterium]|nr:amidohydrolase family protein [Limisphaerales bacterium]
MAGSPLLLLRARVVLPIHRPPIADGGVVVSGQRIAAVGRWRALRSAFAGEVHELGDVVLLPGLVNAHCHLDYTHMVGLFPPQKRFCDWIKLITTEKAHWTFSDYAEAWLDGASMLLRSGTTTVADIEAVPELLPDVWTATPLRVLSFLEMTGVRSRREPELILREALEKIDALPAHRCSAALSPHAPYSTTRRLLQRTATFAGKRQLRVTTHVAESATEFEMFRHARGEMFEWLQRNERDMADCGRGSPVQHVAGAGLLGRNFLAAHVNCLAPGDAALLARRQASVVHCPRSHDYFKHPKFPYRALARAGVNICLGTDSLATVQKTPRQKVELNLFAEMRAFAKAQPRVPPEQIIRMATTNGARALGLRSQVGELRPKAFADLIALPFAGKPTDSYAAVVAHAGPLTAGMIDGDWTLAPRA